ncbi:DUF3048 domain-containing protein [Isachenkonia alkalipeptolytica]|uniref:DUF3048 domain-containing protein n=1 Tax=Isachenkonia alkalipeptolytica TaxID=2565777 RepID=A0AA44BGG1_9CLOT|nr:DUF3048 domain-containing protein [Isachenkonia alkalipeptolytica]NBG89321.1 DUF3048 domain-containing protein [Isachenkonia alkalipeptolytica]
MKLKNKLKLENIMMLLLALVMMFLIGCSTEEEEPKEMKEEEERVEEKEEPEEDSEEETEEPGIPSPLSGLYEKDEERLERPVVGVMYDNNPNARPQAGLHDAEMIYEFYVEGNATRYLAFFLMNDPEFMGPVRSARPYYIEKAMEYHAIYVHAGASSRVTEEIRSLGIQNVSLSGPGAGAFWRESHRRAPHNAYTSMDNIRSTAEALNYRETSDFAGYEFHQEKEALKSGQTAENFEVRYHSSYRAEYHYNEEQQGYDRYYVDRRHYDENHTDDEEKPIVAANVLVQIVPARQIPGTSSGILEMDTIGSGSGYYFTMGEVMEVQWEKSDKEDFTRYYDSEGEEIILNPGQTWIQVISREDILTVEELDQGE